MRALPAVLTSLALGLSVLGCATELPAPHQIPVVSERMDLAYTPAGVPAYCRLPDEATITSVAVSDVPRWFFKPLPDSAWIGYLGEGGNKLLNLETGRVIPVPGNNDAVPTPDGRYLSVPGITLFSMAELLDRSQPVETRLAVALHGEYQSPGIIAQSETETTYRFIVDQQGPKIRDFEVRHRGDAEASITAPGKLRRLCPEKQLQLPMIAPNGHEFGAYDVQTGSTHILKINSDDSCESVLNLGIATGKLSFSYDGRYVAFHLAHREKFSRDAFEVPEDVYASSVFIVDRKLLRMARLTHNTISNAYYPAYRRDGSLVYLFKPYEKSGGSFSFVVADPARIHRWVPLAWITGWCDENRPACARSLALGGLWERVCSQHDKPISPVTASLHRMSLRSQNCTQLVSDHWLTHRDEIVDRLQNVAGGPALSELGPEVMTKACEF